jgi:hypothetical protein
MIRRATEKDIKDLIRLLEQVVYVHHLVRPDIFKIGTKYDKYELSLLIRDNSRPIFVYDDSGVKGYAFTIFKKNINDPILTRLKMHNNQFIGDMNVIRNYQIKILSDNESIGLEEVFLRLPYLMKSTVISEKIFCYELALEHLDKMLTTGKDILNDYIKFSVNKTISLIERLQNIKHNSINMSLIKFEKEMLINKGLIKLGNDIKNNNNKKQQKEENKEISRNKRYIKKNKKSSEKDINSNQIKDNNNECVTIINENVSSPIKLYVTNISAKSKSMFEKLNITYKKI